MTSASTTFFSPFLNTSIVFSEDESQRIYELTRFATDTANYINQREIANYPLLEVLTGQKFFNTVNIQQPRLSFRQVYSFGAISAGATLSVNHNITNVTLFTSIYGTVITDAIDYRPIPYVSTSNINQQISVTITPTQFVIVVGGGSPNVTSGVLVLEYLKN